MTPDPQEELPPGITLRAFLDGKEIFSSSGRWLHPLFSLEVRLPSVVDRVLLHDKVTGRAAAFLMARMGIKNLVTGVLSRRAVPILIQHGIAYQYSLLVDRIACSTEDLLLQVGDMEQAFTMLAKRRRESE